MADSRDTWKSVVGMVDSRADGVELWMAESRDTWSRVVGTADSRDIWCRVVRIADSRDITSGIVDDKLQGQMGYIDDRQQIQME